MMDFLFSEDVRRDPYPWYAEVRRVSPVVQDRRTGAWMVFGYDDVRHVLHDPATFSSVVAPPSSGPGQWLIFADPPRHTRLRALISHAFTSRTVADLEPRVTALAHALLDDAPAGAELELLDRFSVPLPLMVIAELLGAPIGDWRTFRRWSDAIVSLVDTVMGGAAGARAIAAYRTAHAEMQAYVAPLLAERRDTPRDDLLSRLVAAEADGERLTDDELLGFFQLLLLAGHETTTNLIGNAVLTLATAPRVADRLRADRALVPRAIEEVLRHRAPVQAAFRLTTRDATLSGRTIPARSLVLAMIGSANRDPARFVDPDRFDVARESNAHLAFGHGIHHCVGAPLARLEARVALVALLERFPTLALARDEPWEPRAAFHVHGPARLWLRAPTRV